MGEVDGGDVENDSVEKFGISDSKFPAVFISIDRVRPVDDVRLATVVNLVAVSRRNH